MARMSVAMMVVVVMMMSVTTMVVRTLVFVVFFYARSESLRALFHAGFEDGAPFFSAYAMKNSDRPHEIGGFHFHRLLEFFRVEIRLSHVRPRGRVVQHKAYRFRRQSRCCCKQE